jgi:hypothetical protein
LFDEPREHVAQHIDLSLRKKGAHLAHALPVGKYSAGAHQGSSIAILSSQYAHNVHKRAQAHTHHQFVL